jgi:hypothetical protein
MRGSLFLGAPWGSATVAVAGVAIVANAIITARSNLACVRIHVATRRPIVDGRAIWTTAPVRLDLGSVLPVVSINMDLSRGSDD